jgi:hypothetical protein
MTDSIPLEIFVEFYKINEYNLGSRVKFRIRLSEICGVVLVYEKGEDSYWNSCIVSLVHRYRNHSHV